MQVIESIKLAIGSIMGNKLRSFLTLLGIVVGLFSIIIVMTAISAVQQNIVDAFNAIGSQNFIVNKYPAFIGDPHRQKKYRNRKNLTAEQGKKLKEMTSLPLAVGIAEYANGKVVKFLNEKTNPNVPLVGVNQDYFIARDLRLGEGRNLTKDDYDFSRPLAMIGTDVVDKLFKKTSPVGQTIKIDNIGFEVVGVFEKRGSVLGQSQDNFVVVPLGAFEKHFGTEHSAQYLIMASSKELLEKTEDEVIGALRKIRKVPVGEENDFEILTNEQLVETVNSFSNYVKLGAGVVAAIALLAAGVGIMNIMLVSVTERTREIGIRKAIGARKRAILTQFVIEAVALSWVGGLIGIVLGIVGGNIVAVTLGVSIIIPVVWIIIGLLVTTFVGVLFGVYPAVKASNLDPIEALRYE